jgi:hypothetical protein
MMAKGDYPAGALVKVIQEYKSRGGRADIHKRAIEELKHIMLSVVELEKKVNALTYPSCETCFFNGSCPVASDSGACGIYEAKKHAP